MVQEQARQIQDFVHRTVTDTGFRGELQRDAPSAIGRLGFSHKVAGIALQLTPHLVSETLPQETDRWWD